MNKIVVQSGLLVFFISIIFFSQRGMAVQDVLIRSMVLFVATSIMLSIFLLVLLRAINRASVNKRKSLSDNIGREELP